MRLGIPLAHPNEPYSLDDLFRRLGVSRQRRGLQPYSASRSKGIDLYAPAQQGERHTRLAVIAGTLLAKGLSPDDALMACRGWNAGNPTPLDDAEVEATAKGIARKDQRQMAGNATRSGALQPLFDIAEARVDLLLTTSPQPRRWLLTDFLPLNIVGMVVAPGGTGKSQLMLQLGISVAAGVPLCELWPVGEQGVALLLSAEDDRDEVHRRLARTVQELAPNHTGLAQALRANLLIKSLVTEDNLMTRNTDRGGSVEPSDYVGRLLLALQGVPDLKLIVVDPASRFRGGNENSADDVTRFVQELERLREATGATVLVCHHANKAGQYANSGGSAQTKGRGSSAMTDAVRWQVNLEFAAAANASRNGLKLEVAKSNYTRPLAAVSLVRKDSGYLTAQHPIGVPATLEGRILKLIADEAQAGRSYTANAISTKFGGATQQLQAGEIKVRKAINGLVDSKKLSGGKGRQLTLPRSVSPTPVTTC